MLHYQEFTTKVAKTFSLEPGCDNPQTLLQHGLSKSTLLPRENVLITVPRSVAGQEERLVTVPQTV
jgi:hypothetical protein